MVKEKMIIKGSYIRVLKVLYKSHRSMYISEISKRADLTYSFAIIIIKEMFEKGLVKKEKITKEERKNRGRGKSISNFWKETDLGKRLMLVFQEIEARMVIERGYEKAKKGLKKLRKFRP